MTKTYNHLAGFLQTARAIRATGGGTRETSYYPALCNLFDAVGTGLKPKVRAVMQLKNLGAGNPDGGLFTQDQSDRKTGEAKNLAATARGVIEVKSPAEAVDDTAVGARLEKLDMVRETTGKKRDHVYSYAPYLPILSEGGEPIR